MDWDLQGTENRSLIPSHTQSHVASQDIYGLSDRVEMHVNTAGWAVGSEFGVPNSVLGAPSMRHGKAAGNLGDSSGYITPQEVASKQEELGRWRNGA